MPTPSDNSDLRAAGIHMPPVDEPLPLRQLLEEHDKATLDLVRAGLNLLFDMCASDANAMQKELMAVNPNLEPSLFAIHKIWRPDLERLIKELQTDAR